MKKPEIPESVLSFFRKTGAAGGTKRANRHTKEQLSEWGKLGGRPKGSGKNQQKATKKGKK
jgi:hypothetical protein